MREMRESSSHTRLLTRAQIHPSEVRYAAIHSILSHVAAGAHVEFRPDAGERVRVAVTLCGVCACVLDRRWNTEMGVGDDDDAGRREF